MCLFTYHLNIFKPLLCAHLWARWGFSEEHGKGKGVRFFKRPIERWPLWEALCLSDLMHSHNILEWLLLTYARLSNKLKSQWLIRPGVYFLLISDVGFRGCGATVALLQEPFSFWDPGWNRAFTWHMPFLWLGKVAMAKASTGSFSYCSDGTCATSAHFRVAKFKVRGHSSTLLLQRSTVGHTGIARGVYFCFGKEVSIWEQ